MTDSPTPSAPKGHSILSVLAIVLVSRVGLMMIGYLGLMLLPGSKVSSEALPGDLILSGWTRWDGDWYSRIAREGYTNTPIDSSGQRDTAFLPLYPLAARGAGKLTGDVLTGGLFVSHLAFALAAILFYQLALKGWGDEVAHCALILLCVCPFSFILSAVYGESLLLLFSVAAFVLAERRWWHLAAVCAGAAGATKVVGLAAAIAVILFYLRDIDWRWRNVRWNALWLLLGFAGLGSYIIFLAVRFHEPLAFMAAQRAVGWGDVNSWDAFKRFLDVWARNDVPSVIAGQAPWIPTIHLLLGVLSAGLCIVAWRKLSTPYAAWATMVVLLSYTRWNSFGRHFAVAFPLFIIMAMLLKDRRLYHGVVYLDTLLLALLTILFTHNAWVG